MKLEIEYWNQPSGSINSQLENIETWEGTEEEIFRKFENKNNSLRYCNGSYYKFKDPEIAKKHIDWYKSLSYGESIRLFYGGGVVD